MEFVEDQDFGLQAVEEMIKLLGFTADVLAGADRSTQCLQEASIKMGKSGPLTRLDHPNPLLLGGFQMFDGTNRSAIIVLPLA